MTFKSVGAKLGSFVKFFYFWMLFFLTCEMLYRDFSLKQKTYQISQNWVYLAVLLNVVLIANYFRKVFAQRKNIQTS